MVVRRAVVQDWLAKGLKGRDPNTLAANRILAGQHVIPLIGKTNLKKLTADDVDTWLEGLTSKLASRSLMGVHAILSSERSGRLRHETGSSATWPNWSRRPRARLVARVRP